MKVGRPSDYKPEYCQRLIDHMAEGYSFESFAGVLSTCKQTLYTWLDAHSEFMDAKGIAFEKNRLFWEMKGINCPPANIMNPTLWVFQMKNRFPKEWRDRTEVEQTGTMEHNLKLSPDDRKDLIQALLNERKETKV